MKKIKSISLSLVILLSLVFNTGAYAGTPTVHAKSHVTYVYITNYGNKYHRAGCQYLRKSHYRISLKKAKTEGYTPCSRCNPPR